MLSKTIATKNGGPNYAIKNYIIQVPVIAKTISLPEKDSKNYIIWDSCDLYGVLGGESKRMRRQSP